MRCSQCQRPALYQVGEGDQSHALCLTCWATIEDVQFRKWLQLSAMMNQSLDDMDSITPFMPSKGRIPVAEIARAASRSKTYNNIHITNSNVGVINTGNLAKIDAAITISRDTDAEEFGARLKDLTDAILSEASLDGLLKQQMIEVVQAISDQVISSKPASKPVVSALFAKIKEMASNTTIIVVAVEKLQAAWSSLSTML